MHRPSPPPDADTQSAAALLTTLGAPACRPDPAPRGLLIPISMLLCSPDVTTAQTSPAAAAPALSSSSSLSTPPRTQALSPDDAEYHPAHTTARRRRAPEHNTSTPKRRRTGQHSSGSEFHPTGTSDLESAASSHHHDDNHDASHPDDHDDADHDPNASDSEWPRRAVKSACAEGKPRLFAHPALARFAETMYGRGEGLRGHRLLLVEGYVYHALFGVSHVKFATAFLGGRTRKTSLEHMGARIRYKGLERAFAALLAELREWVETPEAAAQVDAVPPKHMQPPPPPPPRPGTRRASEVAPLSGPFKMRAPSAAAVHRAALARRRKGSPVELTFKVEPSGAPAL